MNSYGYRKPTSSKFQVNDYYPAERLEVKIARITTNKEPIEESVPLVYTERADGVQPGYNIRTDRFEVAVEAMDKVTQQNLLKREMRKGEKTYDTMTPEEQKAFNTKFPKNKYAPKDNPKKE